MSKLDAQRAMREAKWARTQERAAAAGASSTAPARRSRPPVAPPLDEPAAADKAPKAATSEAVASGDALCGHASMNGRTCTRPAGHPQKSHRYS